MKRLFKTLLLFNRYKKSVQKRTDFFDNSFFNAVPDKPLATRNKPHNNQLCADLSRFISAYSVVSHFLRFAWQTTFENDCSSARPEGSMQVCRVYWWKHDGKTPKVSSAKIHNAVQIKEKAELNGNEPNSVADYDIILNNPEGAVQPEIIDNI